MRQHSLLAAQVIGASCRVHNALGPGFPEFVHASAPAIEMQRLRLPFIPKVPLPVTYPGRAAGEVRADFVVAEVVVVDIKAQEALLPEHLLRLRACLRAGKIEHGLAIHFGPHEVDVRRAIESAVRMKRH
jgi:GxxExxY protein